MSKPFKSYTQFELFPEGAKRDYQPANNFQSRSVTVLMEHLVGICIVFVLTNVVVFCLGVKRGQIQNPGEVTLKKIVADKNKDDAIIIRSEDAQTDGTETSITQEETVPAEQGSTEVVNIELPKEVIEDFKYTIQVASFKEQESAAKEQLNLKKKGFEASILQKGSHSIVVVGKFLEHREAKKFSERLKNRYKDCLVRRF